MVAQSPIAYTFSSLVLPFLFTRYAPFVYKSKCPFPSEEFGLKPTAQITISASYLPLSVTTPVTFVSPSNSTTFSPRANFIPCSSILFFISSENLVSKYPLRI